MQQVADGVFRLGSRSHNFYLILEGKSATVIDAGCSREWSALASGLASVGLEVSDISGMIATHVHADHLGLGKRLQDNGVRVLVPHDDESRALGTYQGRFSATITDLPIYSLRAWRNMWPMVKAGVMKLEHLEVVDTYAPDAPIDLPGSLRSVHTPGHTEGHSAFHMPGAGIVFTGDCLITMDLLKAGKGPQPINDVFSVDAALNRESIRALSGLDADLILPGHGEPWSGPVSEAVDLALA